MKIINCYGEERDLADLAAADRLIKLKSTSDVWTVIAEIIKIWTAKHPQRWQSYLIELKDIKETRADKTFGRTRETLKHRGDQGNLRILLDVPFPIIAMIRKLYTPEELPMSTIKWQREFARRFPLFRVAEKI